MNHMDIRRKQILTILYIPALLFLIWFLNQLGDSGSGYFIITVQFFLLPITMFWGFLPRVMEKLLRSRMSKGQYKNADVIWKCSFLYSIFTGILCPLICLCFSDLFTEKVLSIPHLRLAFKLFIPVLFFFSICYVLKGYFQGMGSGMPTVISNVVFFVCTGIFGHVIMMPMLEYGKKVSALLQNNDFIGMYGSAGLSIGVVVGSAFASVLLILLFAISGINKRKRIRDGMKMTENYSVAFKLILLSLLPHMLCSLLLILPINLDFVFLKNKYENVTLAVENYGVFYKDFFLLILVLVLFNMISLYGFYKKYVLSIKKEEYKHGRDYMQAALLWIFMTAGLLSVSLITLGEPIVSLYSPARTDIVSKQLQYGGILVFLLTVSIFLCLILWKIGKEREILIVLAVSSLIHVLVSYFTMRVTDGNVNSIIYAYLAQFIVIMFLLGMLLFRSYRIGINLTRTILLPVLSIAVSGIIMLSLGSTFISIFGGVIGLLLCILTGGVVNALLLIILRCLRLKELYVIPGGKIIIYLGKILHILK